MINNWMEIQKKWLPGYKNRIVKNTNIFDRNTKLIRLTNEYVSKKIKKSVHEKGFDGNTNRSDRNTKSIR